MVGADNGEIAQEVEKAGLGGAEAIGFEAPGEISGGPEAGGRKSLTREGAFQGDANHGRGGGDARRGIGARTGFFFGWTAAMSREEGEENFAAGIEHNKLFRNEQKENEDISFLDMLGSGFDIAPVFIDNVGD